MRLFDRPALLKPLTIKPRTRAQARQAILQAANRRRVWKRLPLWSARHIHQAVQVCRFRGLVSDEVLVLAGFNPVGGR